MKIPVSVIIEGLKGFDFTVPEGFDRTTPFDDILLMLDSGAAKPGCLYIGEAALYADRYKNLRCVVTGACKSNNCIAVLGASPQEVYNAVHSKTKSVRLWLEKMYVHAIRGKSVQDILDLSEAVIGNFISISDSAFSLLAYTRGVECDDPVCQKLVANGYHPESTINSFREKKLLQKWNSGSPHSISIIDRKNHNDVMYDTVDRVFRFHNTYFSHVVMTCCHRPADAYIVDLFKMLTDIIAVYAEQSWENKNRCHHTYDAFLSELISGSIKSGEIIEERAKNLHMPVSEPARLYRVRTNADDAYLIYRLESELSGISAATAIVTLYEGEILLLSFLSGEDALNAFCDSLSAVLSKFGAVCGVSTVMRSLSELSLSYKECAAAIALGAGSPAAVLDFDKLSTLYVTSSAGYDVELWRRTRYCRALARVASYDREHGTDNLSLLEVFLMNERKATETGMAMHLHRNSIIYRMAKVEELLGFCLDDPVDRRATELSLAVFKRYNC